MQEPAEAHEEDPVSLGPGEKVNRDAALLPGVPRCSRAALRQALAVFLICFAVYGITNYGGVRPPDSEVVFRVAESLADGRGFSPQDLQSWPGFGVSRGTDGRLYSVYPPMESIALVPAVKLGELINQSEWYSTRPVPYSHYVGNGLNNVMFGAPEPDRAPHALRYLVSWFDVLISALVAVAFYGVLLALTRSRGASLIVSLFYALGTLAWPYAGSFFSEPLALLFVLISFYGLLAPRWSKVGIVVLALSGAALGLAVATHITAVLFVPFFALYLFCDRYRQRRVGREEERGGNGKADSVARPGGEVRTGSDVRYPRPWSMVFVWLAGLGVVLLLLGYYNYVRFGSFLESGRSLSEANKVQFIRPFSAAYWRDLYNVLFAGGKGLLLFCPAVIIGAAFWPRFHRVRPMLSTILLATIIVRLLFNASYKDWHAGFSLGPRYLLLTVPFLLIPPAFWLKAKLEARSCRAIVGIVAAMYLCVVQQIYFALGDIFSYYHLVSFAGIRKGLNLVLSQRIYLDWSLSPLVHLHEYKRGPFLLRGIPVSNLALWLVGCGVCLAIFVAVGIIVRRSQHQPGAPNPPF
jgi:hypothetical protein